jgi:hypothetical protein
MKPFLSELVAMTTVTLAIIASMSIGGLAGIALMYFFII